MKTCNLRINSSGKSREIARLYGLTEWHNISPVQLDTFQNWLRAAYYPQCRTGQIAIRGFPAEKDGQPSPAVASKITSLSPLKR